MNRVLKVTRLHLNKPQQVFAVPLYIIIMVVIVSVIINLVLQRIGLDPNDPAYVQGARQNLGIVWSLPGFLVYLGVQAVSTTFPFALALGTTRRAYVFGTAIANLIQSAYIAIVLAILLGIEVATGHWFMSAYTIDNIALGSGNVWILIPTVFLGVFSALTIGGAFGAIWVRYGPKGVIALSLVLILMLSLTLLILAPKLVEIVMAITRPNLTIASMIVILVALAGTWACMRRTSVR